VEIALPEVAPTPLLTPGDELAPDPMVVAELAAEVLATPIELTPMPEPPDVGPLVDPLTSA
jgi:hypothetical protein